MADKSGLTQAVATPGSEKFAGFGHSVSHGDGEVIEGSAHLGGDPSGEIRRGLKSRHIQFL